jgi:drug/metabolite transporter (DMT)-like permease
LILSYSLILPTLYGMLALSEPVKLSLLVGLCLLLLSLALTNLPDSKEKKPLSLRWTVYVSVTFLTNGICATVQKVFQATYQGQYSSSFMILSLSLTVFVLAIAALIIERKSIVCNLRRGALWYGLCGVGNGAMNQMTMLLAVSLPASFLYPVQSAGGILLCAAASILCYRERLSRFQKIGLLVGVAAVIALNL